MAIHYDKVQHLCAREHPDPSACDLLGEGLIATEQELLPCLATGVEGALHLGSTKGTVIKQSSVFPGERHSLGDALVNDIE